MRVLTIPKDKINCLLRDYEISSNAKISYLQGGIENINLLIEDGIKKYVLRIYNNKKINVIKSEIEIIQYLHEKNIPTPIIYQNSKGKYYQKVDDTYAVLFSFVSGKHIPTKPIKGTLAKDIGFKLANMQKELINFKPTYKRKCSYANDISEFNGKYKSINTYVKNKRELIIKEIKKIVITKLRKSTIHSDITRENILIKGNKVASFLDFDDFHKDYIVWDTAIAITQLFITKTFGIDWNGLNEFLKGYTKVMNLNEYEKEAIIPFLKLRNFRLAMQVNYMRNVGREKNKHLKSIEESVLNKMNQIEKNEKKLKKIILSIT